jgi:hypothetical protein
MSVVTVAFLACAMALPLAGQPGGTGKTPPAAEVLAADRQWAAATKNVDIPLMERLLADQFAFVHIEGGLFDRTTWLNGFRKWTPEQRQRRLKEVSARTRTEPAVRMVGDSVAIVTDQGDQSIVTYVWVRVKQRWQLAHGQVTRIETAQPKPGTQDK